jgi:hypothetical protein
MSITKFVSIKNVGRFKNYNADGNVALKRVNLVFAENGRGKAPFVLFFVPRRATILTM